jgi:hypothetical protein
MEEVMNLTEEHLQKIGEYIKRNFDEISGESRFSHARAFEMQTSERLTRVEEEVKAQRDIILMGFQQMDKRFELMQKDMDERFKSVQKRMDDRFSQVDRRFDDVNKRFDDVNKRFAFMMWAMGAGFAILTTSLSLIAIFGK